jgi:plasmid stabilization system protein ParE
MRFRFSRRAEADLDEIAAHIGRDNTARAVAYVRGLREHCRGAFNFSKARRLRHELKLV